MGTLKVDGSARTSAPCELALTSLHRQILTCSSCVDCGLLAAALPVLPAPVPTDVALVGQAPGRVEGETQLPFSGRAGRQLFRWLLEAGLGDEARVRDRIYVTSITKCYPGPALSGAGDRRPSGREVELCSGHLEAQLALLKPWLIIAVGQLAIGRFLGNRPMEQVVGQLFRVEGAEIVGPNFGRVGTTKETLVLPLPHPSGASRWLNQVGHRELLARALRVLTELLRSPERSEPIT